MIGVAIFLACIVLIVVAFLRRTEYVNVTLRISNEKTYVPYWEYNPADWFIANLKPGLADKDFLGRTNLEISNVYYYPTTGTTQTVYVTIKVRSVFNKTSGQYLYSGVPLLVGELQTFKIKGLSIQGVIREISTQDKTQEKKNFIGTGSLEMQNNENIQYPANIHYEGIRYFIANKISPGMKVLDNHGNVVAEILDVKKSPGTREFTDNGSVVTVPDSDRQKIDLTVRFTTSLIDGRYLYREEEPLILGNLFTLDFSDLTVLMTLKDVKPD